MRLPLVSALSLCFVAMTALVLLACAISDGLRGLVCTLCFALLGTALLPALLCLVFCVCFASRLSYCCCGLALLCCLALLLWLCLRLPCSRVALYVAYLCLLSYTRRNYYCGCQRAMSHESYVHGTALYIRRIRVQPDSSYISCRMIRYSTTCAVTCFAIILTCHHVNEQHTQLSQSALRPFTFARVDQHSQRLAAVTLNVSYFVTTELVESTYIGKMEK